MGVLGADSRRTLIHPASQSSGLRMTFWQENYAFIKDVYNMRHQKMAEWMENVEKAIARIMADKVYTSAEFKRERDNFHALCKDLERAEVKKWLSQILEILKSLNDWMVQATGELTAIRDAAGSMLPEDRVARTMDLQEDIASKLQVLKANTATEKDLLPQGDKPPQDAQDYKDELNRITKYITDLDAQTRKECDAYSEDVKYWADYRTGIKEFSPWWPSARSLSLEASPSP